MTASTIPDALAPLVDFVYPPRCALCGVGIAQAPGICADCWNTIEFPSDSEGHETSRAEAHGRIIAATIYTDPTRQLVLRFKHGGRLGLGKLMGRMIASRLAHAPANAVLVPVPLHRWRLWRRGFNQAAVLAKEIAATTGHRVVLDALNRPRATPSLGGLSRGQRAKALRGAILLNPKRQDAIKGRPVILVDDVLTSGATTNACIRVLKQAGARSVDIACFARVPDPQNETPETVQVPGAA